MKMLPLLTLLAALCMGMHSNSLAQTPSAETYLKRGQTSFENSLASIRDKDQTNRNQLARQYLQSLATLEAQYKQAGSLDPLIAVRDEMQRFTDTKTVSEEAPAKAAKELAQLINHYHRLFADQALSNSREIVSLVDKYDHSLRGLQGKYTQIDRIDDALVVKNKRAEIAAMDFVIDARAMVGADDAERSALQRERAQMQREQAIAKPAPGAVPNTFRGSDKKRIGDRYDAFIESLSDEDLDATTDLINPDQIEQTGTEVVKTLLKAFVPAIKLAKKFGVDFRTGKITFDPNGTDAVQIPVYDGPNENKDMDPVNWIKVRGEWYLKM